MCLYFLKGSSGFIKSGRSSNFDKRLSEIRRGTTDEYVEVLKVFYGDEDYIRTRERELHIDLGADNFKGEWFHDTESVGQALESCDREFNPERFVERSKTVSVAVTVR
jgi:Meiotically up-regulated gene 113